MEKNYNKRRRTKKNIIKQQKKKKVKITIDIKLTKTTSSKTHTYTILSPEREKKKSRNIKKNKFFKNHLKRCQQVPFSFWTQREKLSSPVITEAIFP